jgi:hypothetical protein
MYMLKDVEEVLDFTAPGLVHVSCNPGLLTPLLTFFITLLTISAEPILTKGDQADLDKFVK